MHTYSRLQRISYFLFQIVIDRCILSQSIANVFIINEEQRTQHNNDITVIGKLNCYREPLDTS